MSGSNATSRSSSPPSAKELNGRLANLEVDELLRVAAAAFTPGRLALLSAFGPTSLVLLHKLHGLGIRLPTIFIDTLHHFPETLEHVEVVRRRYDLDLRVFRPCATRKEFEERYGPELWKRDLDRYQEVSKVEPYRRAIADLDAWITGRRREQSTARADLPLVEDGPRLRINPLLDWTRTDVWRFILDNGIPYNPLHDRGYASIGDQPLTTAVQAGEDERAGRWRGSGRTECGIHVAPIDP
jgi:phosphoadenosine phosphosulfate reductase